MRSIQRESLGPPDNGSAAAVTATGDDRGAARWWILGLLAATLVAAGLPPAEARLWLLIVLAPLVEELVFRSGLHEALLRRGVRNGRAIVLTAGTFALAHGLSRSWGLALAVCVPALVIGSVYARARRVGPCVLLHAAFNMVWLFAVPLAFPALARWG